MSSLPRACGGVLQLARWWEILITFGLPVVLGAWESAVTRSAIVGSEDGGDWNGSARRVKVLKS